MAKWLQWTDNPVDPATRGCIPVTTKQLRACHWAFESEPTRTLCTDRLQVIDQATVDLLTDAAVRIKELPPCRPCLRSQKLHDSPRTGNRTLMTGTPTLLSGNGNLDAGTVLIGKKTTTKTAA